MIKHVIKHKTLLNVNESIEGEKIETKIERIVSNKEPIEDAAPIVYQDRKDGVRAEYNIRTDRFEIAIDAMDKVSATKIALRSEYANKDNINKESTEIEPIQGTDKKE